jgi:hypothetical protein
LTKNDSVSSKVDPKKPFNLFGSKKDKKNVFDPFKKMGANKSSASKVTEPDPVEFTRNAQDHPVAIGGFSLESKEKEPSSERYDDDFELLESVTKLGASLGKKAPIKKSDEAAIDDMFAPKPNRKASIEKKESEVAFSDNYDNDFEYDDEFLL